MERDKHREPSKLGSEHAMKPGAGDAKVSGRTWDRVGDYQVLIRKGFLV